jgi:beta-phosphoglucomutase-like phosphatase (HAD superfamily)
MAEIRLGLLGTIRACLFDLDGVLTETAKLHAKPWEQTFDGFLFESARSTRQPQDVQRALRRLARQAARARHEPVVC